MPADPDTLPTVSDPTGPCPRCGRISNFEVINGMRLTHHYVNGWVSENANFLTCLGCTETTVLISANRGTHETGLHWYPAPGAGNLDPAVSEAVASTYDEGMRCLGIGANRSAAVMFRSALHLFVKDKGDEKAKGERHLKNALKAMKDDGSLHTSLWDWADHLNQLGNEGAHPEDYDEITADEAKALGAFVRFLIKTEYEMPAQLLRERGLAPRLQTPEEAEQAAAIAERLEAIKQTAAAAGVDGVDGVE